MLPCKRGIEAIALLSIFFKEGGGKGKGPRREEEMSVPHLIISSTKPEGKRKGGGEKVRATKPSLF